MKKHTCLEPCSYLGIKIIKGSEYAANKNSSHHRLEMFFEEYIHKTINYHSYDGLSFIGEVGGCVGLFLGASFYQIADLFVAIIEKLRSHVK